METKTKKVLPTDYYTTAWGSVFARKEGDGYSPFWMVLKAGAAQRDSLTGLPLMSADPALFLETVTGVKSRVETDSRSGHRYSSDGTYAFWPAVHPAEARCELVHLTGSASVPGVRGSELKPGMVMHYNYGYRGVVAEVTDVSPNYVLVSVVQCSTGNRFSSRKAKASVLPAGWVSDAYARSMVAVMESNRAKTGKIEEAAVAEVSRLLGALPG